MEISTDHLTNPQAPPILRLPPHVRHRIYLHTNVVPIAQIINRYYIHRNYDAFHLRPHISNLHSHDTNSRYRGFSGLLCSCRIIYYEMSTLLYSSNEFIIRYWDQRSLEPLRNLTSHSLSKIRRLKILLNEASCPTGNGGEDEWRMASRDHEVCPIGAGYGGGRVPFSLDMYGSIRTKLDSDGCLEGRDVPLKSGQPLAETVLAEWYATIAHLSSCITPKTLELCLICDVDPKDVEIAKRMVDPLARLPLLRNCHLRLSRISTATLNDLARTTVLRVCGISDARTSMLPQLGHDSSLPLSLDSATASDSRLLALPQELRLRILEFTDLITPRKEVTWGRQYRGFVASRSFCYSLHGMGEDCPPHVHHGCQFDNCWEPYPDPPLGCFCRVKHSAFSSGCKCWEPPQYLFLVCRALYIDSQVIFYSKNRFVIHDFISIPSFKVPEETQLYPFPRLAASIFLTEVVPEHCLRELRFIEFVFPPYHHDCWPQEGQAALEDWGRTIEWLSKRLTLPALTIRLCTAEVLDGDDREYRSFMTRGQGEEMLAAYARVLAPLVRLGSDGLARFYARLSWPWKTTEENIQIGTREWAQAKDRVLKDHAEQLVMGDRYNSLLDGDCEPPDSLWVRRWTRDF